MSRILARSARPRGPRAAAPREGRWRSRIGIALSTAALALLLSARASAAPCALAEGVHARQISVAGVIRHYELVVPSGCSSEERMPLLLDYHGLLGTPANQRGRSFFETEAELEGFFAAYPASIGLWNVAPGSGSSVDDVAFTRALVAEVQSLLPVDPERVVASGFSLGASMVHRLACEAADVFAAVVPVSFPLTDAQEPCVPARPIAILHFHGIADTTVPFLGGAVPVDPPGVVPPVQWSQARWADINGCTGDSSVGVAGFCEVEASCRDGVRVGLCAHEEGHAGAYRSRLIDVPQLAWEFLAGRPLVAAELDLREIERLTQGQDGVDGLRGVRDLALSPDGRQLYAVAADSDSLTVFARDPQSGSLAFVEALRNGAGAATGLSGASGLAVSPDGHHVYAAGPGDGVIATFARGALGGSLEFVDAVAAGGLADLGDGSTVVVSPGGAHVYASLSGDEAVAIYGRDASSGALSFLGAASVTAAETSGADRPRALAVTPDGAQLLVATSSEDADDRVLVLGRDASSGLLTPEGSLETVLGLAVRELGVAPDGHRVWVARSDGLEVHSLDQGRDPATGAYALADVRGNDVAGVRGIAFADGLARNQDTVWVAGSHGAGLASISALDAHSSGPDAFLGQHRSQDFLESPVTRTWRRPLAVAAAADGGAHLYEARDGLLLVYAPEPTRAGAGLAVAVSLWLIRRARRFETPASRRLTQDSRGKPGRRGAPPSRRAREA